MKITVQRQKGTPLSTPGLIDVDGVWEGYTLEPRMDRSQGKPYAIPAGTYKLALEFSPHFQTITPHVLDVPGFEYIEIHWGNYPKDTEGCLLIGMTRGQDFVGNSREAFSNLAGVLENANGDISITYVDYATSVVTDPEIMM